MIAETLTTVLLAAGRLIRPTSDDPYPMEIFGWQIWQNHRVLGLQVVQLRCLVCGDTEWAPMPPRWSTTDRLRLTVSEQLVTRLGLEHLHPEGPDPMDWAAPLDNPKAWKHRAIDQQELLAMLNARVVDPDGGFLIGEPND